MSHLRGFTSLPRRRVSSVRSRLLQHFELNAPASTAVASTIGNSSRHDFDPSRHFESPLLNFPPRLTTSLHLDSISGASQIQRREFSFWKSGPSKFNTWSKPGGKKKDKDDKGDKKKKDDKSSKKKEASKKTETDKKGKSSGEKKSKPKKTKDADAREGPPQKADKIATEAGEPNDGNGNLVFNDDGSRSKRISKSMLHPMVRELGQYYMANVTEGSKITYDHQGYEGENAQAELGGLGGGAASSDGQGSWGAEGEAWRRAQMGGKGSRNFKNIRLGNEEEFEPEAMVSKLAAAGGTPSYHKANDIRDFCEKWQRKVCGEGNGNHNGANRNAGGSATSNSGSASATANKGTLSQRTQTSNLDSETIDNFSSSDLLLSLYFLDEISSRMYFFQERDDQRNRAVQDLVNLKERKTPKRGGKSKTPSSTTTSSSTPPAAASSSKAKDKAGKVGVTTFSEPPSTTSASHAYASTNNPLGIKTFETPRSNASLSLLKEFLDLWQVEATKKFNDFDYADLANCLHLLSSMKIRPSEEFYQAWSDRALKCDWDARDVANFGNLIISHGNLYRSFGVRPSDDLVALWMRVLEVALVDPINPAPKDAYILKEGKKPAFSHVESKPSAESPTASSDRTEVTESPLQTFKENTVSTNQAGVQVLENQEISRSGDAILGGKNAETAEKNRRRRKTTEAEKERQSKEEAEIFAEIQAENGKAGNFKKASSTSKKQPQGPQPTSSSGSSSANSESGSTAVPPTHRLKPELSPQILETITFGLSVLDIVPPRPVLEKLDTALLKIILDASQLSLSVMVYSFTKLWRMEQTSEKLGELGFPNGASRGGGHPSTTNPRDSLPGGIWRVQAAKPDPRSGDARLSVLANADGVVKRAQEQADGQTQISSLTQTRSQSRVKLSNVVLVDGQVSPDVHSRLAAEVRAAQETAREADGEAAAATEETEATAGKNFKKEKLEKEDPPKEEKHPAKTIPTRKTHRPTKRAQWWRKAKGMPHTAPCWKCAKHYLIEKKNTGTVLTETIPTQGKPFILHPGSLTGPGSSGSCRSNSGPSASDGSGTTSSVDSSSEDVLKSASVAEPSDARVSKWQDAHTLQRQKLANSITSATAEFIRTKKKPTAAWVDRWEKECLQITSQAIVATGMGLGTVAPAEAASTSLPLVPTSDAEVQDFLQILWSLSQLCGLEGEGIHVSEEVLGSLYDWTLLNLLRRGVDESGGASAPSSKASDFNQSDTLPVHAHASNLYHALLALARTTASRIGAPGTHEASQREKTKSDLQTMRGKVRVAGNGDDDSSRSDSSNSVTGSSSDNGENDKPEQINGSRPATTSSIWLGRQIKFFVREWETKSAQSLDMFSSEHISGTLAALGMIQEWLTSVQAYSSPGRDTLGPLFTGGFDFDQAYRDRFLNLLDDGKDSERTQPTHSEQQQHPANKLPTPEDASSTVTLEDVFSSDAESDEPAKLVAAQPMPYDELSPELSDILWQVNGRRFEVRLRDFYRTRLKSLAVEGTQEFLEIADKSDDELQAGSDDLLPSSLASTNLLRTIVEHRLTEYGLGLKNTQLGETDNNMSNPEPPASDKPSDTTLDELDEFDDTPSFYQKLNLSNFPHIWELRSREKLWAFSSRDLVVCALSFGRTGTAGGAAFQQDFGKRVEEILEKDEKGPWKIWEDKERENARMGSESSGGSGDGPAGDGGSNGAGNGNGSTDGRWTNPHF